ncbi:MAG: porin family protein [Gammaproteobacteria bacterium]|nr:porin family protein [Gammaproteobacteria bacterium]
MVVQDEEVVQADSRDDYSFDVMLGSRTMTNDDWDAGYVDLSVQPMIGIGGAAQGSDSGIGTEWALLIASVEKELTINGSSTDVSAASLEVDFGLRKTFNTAESRVRPFVGGGVALITTTAETEVQIGDLSADGSESDTAFGLYIHAGASVALGNNFALGLDYRVLTGANYGGDLEDSFGDADYDQFMIVLSFQ